MDIFGDFTGLYFYSTIVQGNMALLGLAALFAVFRLQVLYELRGEANNKIVSFVKEFFFEERGGLPRWLHAHAWNADELVHALKGFKEGDKEADYQRAQEILADRHFTQLLVEKSFLEMFQKEVTTGLRKPLLLTVSVTAFSLVLLPFSAAIHRLRIFGEGGLFVIVILLNIIALISNFRFVLRSLSYGHPVLG